MLIIMMLFIILITILSKSSNVFNQEVLGSPVERIHADTAVIKPLNHSLTRPPLAWTTADAKKVNKRVVQDAWIDGSIDCLIYLVQRSGGKAASQMVGHPPLRWRVPCYRTGITRWQRAADGQAGSHRYRLRQFTKASQLGTCLYSPNTPARWRMLDSQLFGGSTEFRGPGACGKMVPLPGDSARRQAAYLLSAPTVCDGGSSRERLYF